MDRFEHLLILSLGMTAVCVSAPPAHADSYADRATARELFFQAVDAVDAGDHTAAAELFERSNTLYPAPTAALGLARALAQTGQWVRATETYHAIVRTKAEDDEPAAFASARAAAAEELAELTAKMPHIVVVVRGPDSTVLTIDGVAVPRAAFGVKRPVDPGTRKVEARAEGHRAVTREVQVEAGAVTRVQLTLEPEEPAAAPQPLFKPGPVLRTIVQPRHGTPRAEPTTRDERDNGVAISGYVLGSVGVLGFIGAAVSGGLFVSARATMEEACNERADGSFRCSPAGLDAVDRGRALETANTALLIVGGVGLAAGISFVVAGHVAGTPAEVVLTPSVSPTQAGLGLRVRF